MNRTLPTTPAATPLPSLRLQQRPAMTPLGPPPLAAFARGARLRDPENDPLIWLAPSESTDVAPTLATRPRLAAIPLPLRAPSPRSRPCRATRPPLDAFRLRPSSVAWAIATLGPLLAGPALAKQPVPPKQPTATTSEADTPADEAPVTETPAVPSPPLDHLGYDGVRIWEAVRGETVIVNLVDGMTLRGVLLTEGAGEIAIAREPDGLLMRIPKDLVLGLRLPPAPPPPQPWREEEERAVDRVEKRPASGEGLIGVGLGLTLGGAALLTGFALSAGNSAAYYTFPLLLVAPALLAPGIPLLAEGGRMAARRTAWDRAQLELSSGPIRGGWSGRLSLRF